jgi:hypothetical protein
MAKAKSMKRTTKPGQKTMIRTKPPKRKQIGCLLDTELWTEVKILALKQGRTAGEVLEDSMREYLKKHGKK